MVSHWSAIVIQAIAIIKPLWNIHKITKINSLKINSLAYFVSYMNVSGLLYEY